MKNFFETYLPTAIAGFGIGFSIGVVICACTFFSLH